MPLAAFAQPFDHPDWLFELKYDGFRALAYIENGSARMVSRKGNVYKAFPELCRDLAGCIQAKSAVLDGEIVHLDQTGRSQFYSLLRRQAPQQFVAFDLLSLDGRDITRQPLLERKRLLRSIVPATSSCVVFAKSVPKNGSALYRLVCESDLEGIVAKRKDGLYTPEETSWVKIRNPQYSQIAGRHELFGRRRAG